MSDEAITLKELRDFTKRTDGDAKIYVEGLDQVRHDIVDAEIVKTMDGIKVILGACI